MGPVVAVRTAAATGGLADDLVERLTDQEFHRHEHRPVVGAAEVVDADGIRVAQAGHDAGFLLETADEFDALFIADDHELEGHALTGCHMLGGVDGTHRALADDAGDAKAAGDDVALGERTCHLRIGWLGHGRASWRFLEMRVGRRLLGAARAHRLQYRRRCATKIRPFPATGPCGSTAAKQCARLPAPVNRQNRLEFRALNAPISPSASFRLCASEPVDRRSSLPACSLQAAQSSGGGSSQPSHSSAGWSSAGTGRPGVRGRARPCGAGRAGGRRWRRGGDRSAWAWRGSGGGADGVRFRFGFRFRFCGETRRDDPGGNCRWRRRSRSGIPGRRGPRCASGGGESAREGCRWRRKRA